MVGVAACSDDEVVLVGRTDGDWEGANAGGTDVAVSKLSVDNGAAIWRYQARDSHANPMVLPRLEPHTKATLFQNNPPHPFPCLIVLHFGGDEPSESFAQ